MKQKQSQKKCRICRDPGHNVVTCPLLDEPVENLNTKDKRYAWGFYNRQREANARRMMSEKERQEEHEKIVEAAKVLIRASAPECRRRSIESALGQAWLELYTEGKIELGFPPWP